MKIITWNCNMKFRQKFKEISKLDADIYVIQECEDPAEAKSKLYKDFASNYFWIGDNPNKGLGIFANDNIKIERMNIEDGNFRYFLPVRVNNKFNLLGIWAMPEYVREILNYYDYNEDKNLFNNNLVLCGDLNASVIWNKSNPKRNFSTLINHLKNHGLVDVYHYLNKEKQGQESQATYFFRKKLNSSYHTDHVFAAPNIIKDLDIIDNYKWINLSDHLPVLFETNYENSNKGEKSLFDF